MGEWIRSRYSEYLRIGIKLEILPDKIHGILIVPSISR